MKKEAAKRDAPARIAEKAEPPHIMVLKEEAKNSEEAVQTKEKKRNRNIVSRTGLKQITINI